MNIKKFRDLTLITINKDETIVISCDSSGAIGNKGKDIIKVSPEILGYFTSRVALSELLAFGAKPVAIVNTLSVEMDDTGKKIIEGIRKAIKPLNLNENLIITGSTEENFPVCQTGIGITAIGIINKESFRIPKTKKGSLAVVVGIPKVGNEVLEDRGKETLSLEVILKLKGKSYIHEIVPVGSKGILHELNEMANTNNLSYVLEEEIKIDLYKSAGPATCAVVSLDEKYLKKLINDCIIPVNRIAKFV